MQADISKPPVMNAPPPKDAQTPACANCGAPLLGKYCYACGQPTTGMVRHFGSVLSDVADSVLNVDERLFKTLAPLYLRPGKLTIDYFAGKRARYVTPFRLVFFLAIVAFLAAQISVRAGFTHAINVRTPPVDGVSISTSPEATSRKHSPFANGNINFGSGVLWNRETNPLQLAWLPAAGNAWLNDLIGNAQQQLFRMNSGSRAERKGAVHKLILGMFSTAPTVLFVLLPVFALMLKIFYIFKRRLYMEHLIVAMHSHAFLMFSMLVLIALAVLRQVLQPHAGWLAVPFKLLDVAAWIWIFLYLFLMQKRVYRQGWIMTTLKFGCIGFLYTIMVGFGWAFVALISLTGA